MFYSTKMPYNTACTILYCTYNYYSNRALFIVYTFVELCNNTVSQHYSVVVRNHPAAACVYGTHTLYTYTSLLYNIIIRWKYNYNNNIIIAVYNLY